MGKPIVNWAYLIHLGYKMWPYWIRPEAWGMEKYPNATLPDVLLCEKQSWDEILVRLREAGCNMLIIDIGEGVRFDSRPELAIKGTWSKDEFIKELDKIKGMGMIPVPKLNFSAAHDDWLGCYERMVSTPVYYEVVSDVIRETAELFGNTGYFHIGMDEEKDIPNSISEYVVIRKHNLWWHDFNFICDKVRRAGCTPMMWPDMFWSSVLTNTWCKKEDFFEKIPKEDIVICNWYYFKFDDPSKSDIAAYSWLQESGYMQMPTGSTFSYESQFIDMVRYCRDIITPDKLLGYMQTPWKPTCVFAMDDHIKAINSLAAARKEMA